MGTSMQRSLKPNEHITSMCSGFGNVFGGSDCRIRQEASCQLKLWTAGMGTSMQRSLKPNDIHVPGLGYVFGGSECRIRHEANSQLKFWIARMGALMQTYLKPNEKMVGYIGGRIYSPLGLQKPALYLHKEHGTVCTPPCLRKRSFVLQDGAPCWSLYPPHALNISSPTLGMSAISQKSFIPDFNSFIFITLHI
ncbi:hypothetical protein T08_14825 [Trichinella sp. T8]|nr:hypothetical protein T08_14825 [Trichinella sp. T8]